MAILATKAVLHQIVTTNTISPEGIGYINSISTLVLKDQGSSGVEFRTKGGRLYRLWFVETMTIGSHRVFYFILWYIEGKLSGVADAEMGREDLAFLVSSVACTLTEEVIPTASAPIRTAQLSDLPQ